MPLISCPACNSHVSDQAVSCPHCGHPLGNRMKVSDGDFMRTSRGCGDLVIYGPLLIIGFFVAVYIVIKVLGWITSP